MFILSCDKCKRKIEKSEDVIVSELYINNCNSYLEHMQYSVESPHAHPQKIIVCTDCAMLLYGYKETGIDGSGYRVRRFCDFD